MVTSRLAEARDFFELLTLVKEASEEEKNFIQANKDPKRFVKDLLQHILDGTVIVFILDTKIIGYLEYNKLLSKKLWISTLYFYKAYRKYSLRSSLKAFNYLKEKYKMPVHYTIVPENKQAVKFSAFIKAKPVVEYRDGRVEYFVEVL